jgi:hypothetical protein
MDYQIVICSHKRAEVLKQKTISVLSSYDIPRDKIYIFVAAEEVEEYTSVLPDYQIKVGALGLAENRNAVSAYFRSDEYLFLLDDDLRGFKISRGGKLVRLDDLDGFIRQGFKECSSRGFSLWGLYPVANAKWLKDSLSYGLVFCYGCSYGLINKKDVLIETSFKEDYERCIKFYQRDGGVLRLNWVAPVQSYCKGSGGLNQIRTLDKERSACEALQTKYPTLCKIKQNTKSEKVDLIFDRKLCIQKTSRV